MTREITKSVSKIKLSGLKINIYQRVEAIIRNYVGDFEKSDIAREYTKETQRVAGQGVRDEIHNVINKLLHRNPPEIIVVKLGQGSRSGVYRFRKNSQ